VTAAVGTTVALMTSALWSGEVSAQGASLFGMNPLLANEIAVDVNDPFFLNQAPVIVDFGWANNLGSVYVFSGRVIDERPAGLTITFGGVLEGQSATTLADGTFFLSKVLGPEDVGIVSASTVDDLGLDSNVALTIVY
jgi:hypothetical protein